MIEISSAEAHLLKMMIYDRTSNESLIGASVIILDKEKGAVSDLDGVVSFDLESGEYIFAVQYLGYESDTLSLLLQNDTTITVQLNETYNKLSTVEVVADYQDRSNGVVGVSEETLAKIPTFLGEKELVRAIQLLPGVQSGNEGTTAIFVRGGSSDQNLVTFDGVPLFYLSHLFGIMSVFNSDVIRSADLYKNYFPSNFSNRLTSAISVNSKLPSLDETHLGFQMGVVNSRAYVETPIVKDKLSFQLGMRGCHLGLFIKPISKSQYKVGNETGYISYYFYDINSSLYYKINKKHQLKWNFFYTDDRYLLSKSESENDFLEGSNVEYAKDKYADNKIKWGNILQSLSHQWDIGKNIFFQQKFYNTQYLLKQDNIRHRTYTYSPTESTKEATTNTHLAKVIEIGYLAQLDWTKNSHRLKVGFQNASRFFEPDKSKYKKTVDKEVIEDLLLNTSRIFANESSVFAEYVYSSPKLDVFSGLKWNVYHTKGYKNMSLLPRLSLELHLPKKIDMQISSQITEQYVHMVTGTVGDIMSDFWVPANNHAPVQKAFQNAISVKQSVKDWTWSVDVFVRNSNQQIENVSNSNFSGKNNWEDDVLSGGKGRAYGLETYITRKWKGWQFSTSYNLTKSERKFDELNRGQWYPYTYDRRHNVSLMASYTFNEKWDVSVMWVYGTGRPYTMSDLIYPSLNLVDYYETKDQNTYFLDNSYRQIKYFEKRNNRNLAAYHHLDIGMNYKWQKGKWNQTINFSIYNVYNRKNVFDILTDRKGTGPDAVTKYQSLTLLPILPSFSYAIGF